MISVEHLAHRKSLLDAIDTAKGYGDKGEYERAEDALAWYDKAIESLAANAAPPKDGSDVASLRAEVSALQMAVKRLQSDQAVCSRKADHVLGMLYTMREQATAMNNAFNNWARS